MGPVSSLYDTPMRRSGAATRCEHAKDFNLAYSLCTTILLRPTASSRTCLATDTSRDRICSFAGLASTCLVVCCHVLIRSSGTTESKHPLSTVVTFLLYLAHCHASYQDASPRLESTTQQHRLLRRYCPWLGSTMTTS